jgi:hypothetical protein
MTAKRIAFVLPAAYQLFYSCDIQDAFAGVVLTEFPDVQVIVGCGMLSKRLLCSACISPYCFVDKYGELDAVCEQLKNKGFEYVCVLDDDILREGDDCIVFSPDTPPKVDKLYTMSIAQPVPSSTLRRRILPSRHYIK